MTISITPVVLKHHRKPDGSYNVKLRITYGGRSKYIATTVTALPHELTRSLAFKSPDLHNRIAPVLANVREAVSRISPFELEGRDVDFVMAAIRRHLVGGSFRLDFIAYAREWAQRTKTGTTRRSYLQAVEALSRFAGGAIDVNDITRPLLLDFLDYVETAPKIHYNGKTGERVERPGTAKLPGAAAARHLAKLGKIFQEARLRYNDEDAGVILIPRNPFAAVKRPVPKSTGGQKALAPEVIQRIIDARPANRAIREALDVFLLSFVTMGANLADLHEAKKLPAGAEWWTYERRKTRTRRLDRAEIRVKILPEVSAIIGRLQAGPSGWMVPALHRIGRHRDTATANINKHLRSWCESEGLPVFTFYAARHSWATIARRLGVEKATVDEALGHVGDFDLTDIYAERDWQLINAANDRVLASFRW